MFKAIAQDFRNAECSSSERSTAALPALHHLSPTRRGCGLAGWQIRRVKEFIDQQLAFQILVSDLAALSRLSPSHFARSFHVSFHATPHRYVEFSRLRRACALMRSTDADLCQIAVDCGFSDQSHMNRSFKRRLGCTPGFWRRTHDLKSLNNHLDMPQSVSPIACERRQVA